LYENFICTESHRGFVGYDAVDFLEDGGRKLLRNVGIPPTRRHNAEASSSPW